MLFQLLFIPSFFFFPLFIFFSVRQKRVLLCIGSLFFSPSFILMSDPISMLFFFLLYIIRFSCWSQSIHYVKHGGRSFFRFSFLFFFLRISLLIFAGDIFSFFIAWDGLGISSSLLVSYYFSSSARTGGITTLFYNRIGDALLISSFFFFSLSNLMLPNSRQQSFSFFFIFFLIFALFTKRAQIPFSAWLPAAISAPTTVTALVHSSTVVTAGVWGLARARARNWLVTWEVVFFVICGAGTFAFSSFCASFSFDAKRIVAITTLANLGLIIFFIFTGNRCRGVLHLLGHARVKSLSFISLAVMMTESSHTQDLRYIVLAWARSASFLFYVCMLIQGAQLSSSYSIVKHAGLGCADLVSSSLSLTFRAGYFIFFFSVIRLMKYSLVSKNVMVSYSCSSSFFGLIVFCFFICVFVFSWLVFFSSCMGSSPLLAIANRPERLFYFSMFLSVFLYICKTFSHPRIFLFPPSVIIYYAFFSFVVPQIFWAVWVRFSFFF